MQSTNALLKYVCFWLRWAALCCFSPVFSLVVQLVEQDLLRGRERGHVPARSEGRNGGLRRVLYIGLGTFVVVLGDDVGGGGGGGLLTPSFDFEFSACGGRLRGR